MEIFNAILLGAIQGVTEFLPVSSSGHLLLMKHFLDMGEVPILFDVLLHIATLLVVLGFFRRQIFSILRALWHWVQKSIDTEDAYYLRLTVVIIIATVFTVLLGFILNTVDSLHTTSSVSVMFILTGLLLISTKFVKSREDQTPKKRNGILVGIAQGLGTLPGISRSGITITAALWGGIDREKAGELSFLLSIPAILGAFILEIGESGTLTSQMHISAILIGCLSAIISGILSLKLLLWLIRSGKLYFFSIYLIPLGIIGLIWL